MRPNYTTSKAGNTTAENHSSPALLLHGRDTQLRQQKCRPAVRAPRIFKVLNGDVGDGFDAGFAKGGASVVEEDGGRPERGRHFELKPADLERQGARRSCELAIPAMKYRLERKLEDTILQPKPYK